MEKKIMREDSSDIEQGYGLVREPENGHERKKNWSSGSPQTTPAENWMALLDDDTPLSAVTIPGTHDSAAFGSSWPFVSTQKLNILGQLNSGIRYFDLRCGVRDDIVEMVHGPYYLSLVLEEVVSAMYVWLAKHSSEALIVQIKKDRRGNRSTISFREAIFRVLTKAPDRWRIANTIPSIGDLRGRIQLFRRFGESNIGPFGVNLTQWVDNSPKPFTIHTRHNVRITIQDHYTFSHRQTLPSLIAKKGADVSGLLESANNNVDPNHWYMNFTSAFELNIFYQIQPRQIAVGGRWNFRWVDGINVRLRTYLQNNKGRKRCYGIVAMDFPEQGAEDLIAALIKTNFEPDLGSLRVLFVVWLPTTVLMLFLVTGYWLLMERRTLTWADSD